MTSEENPETYECDKCGFVGNKLNMTYEVKFCQFEGMTTIATCKDWRECDERSGYEPDKRCFFCRNANMKSLDPQYENDGERIYGYVCSVKVS